MSAAEDRLGALGLTLPAVVPPVAAYVPAVRFADIPTTDRYPGSVVTRMMTVHIRQGYGGVVSKPLGVRRRGSSVTANVVASANGVPTAGPNPFEPVPEGNRENPG